MNSTRRKLAIATWKAPAEGNIYGKLTVDVDDALQYIEWLKHQSGEKVTITHLVGKAVAMALAQSPGLNGIIRFGRYVQHPTVDVAYLVALEEGKNLAKAKICDLDKKSVVDVARELKALATKLHKGEDEQFKKSQGPLQILPTQLIRPLLTLTGYLTGVLGISVPALGLEAHPFGACVITNVGVFGLDEGFAPPTPFAHAPVYVLVGAVRDNVVVRDGQVVVRKQMTICATIDHRYMDGAQGGVLARVVRDVLERPWQLEGRDGPPPQIPENPARVLEGLDQVAVAVPREA
jgi:pyruvate/2-oxoglutarate dehydrogenase complex dihydrolipoamide acyltransferase (E2) component